MSNGVVHTVKYSLGQVAWKLGGVEGLVDGWEGEGDGVGRQTYPFECIVS